MSPGGFRWWQLYMLFLQAVPPLPPLKVTSGLGAAAALLRIGRPKPLSSDV